MDSLAAAAQEGEGRLVYISGSITGATDDELNMFYHVATDLTMRGYSVFNPREHDVPDASSSEAAWTHALCRDIEIIVQCYGIAVLPTFEHSKGALLEVFTAISLRKKIILFGEQDEDWRDTVQMVVRDVQDRLWLYVDRTKYTHHSNLPSVTRTESC